jgi:hypothetical protein
MYDRAPAATEGLKVQDLPSCSTMVDPPARGVGKITMREPTKVGSRGCSVLQRTGLGLFFHRMSNEGRILKEKQTVELEFLERGSQEFFVINNIGVIASSLEEFCSRDI